MVWVSVLCVCMACTCDVQCVWCTVCVWCTYSVVSEVVGSDAP